MVGRNDTENIDGRGWGVCVCASVCVRTSMHTCVRDVFAIIYDDNILPRLIMIIIKIIIVYFIQIRHTDDFPSTGIPASNYYVWFWRDTFVILVCGVQLADELGQAE